MPPQIANILKNLPNLPGVYRYYGVGDTVLYIGKAKNLKNRVSQYFQNNKINQNPRLQTMVSQIEKIEYTTVKTEKEALVLEANLIYNLQPKYNIQLKDDRSYLYVRISKASVCSENLTLSDLPKITLTRRKYDKSSEYFGPYTKKYGIVNVLRTLRTIFPYCEEAGSKIDLKQKSKPCHYVQLKQCDGICCGRETSAQYLAKITQIKAVLSGETSEVKIWIKSKINEAITISNFQLAGLWRDRLNFLDEVIENQQIILSQPQNLDIVTLIYENDISGMTIASVFIQNIREGKIINLNNFIMSGTQDEIDLTNSEDLTTNSESSKDSIHSFIQTFLVSYYGDQTHKPEILLQVYQNGI